VIVSQNGGFPVSLPSAVEVLLDCLETSPLPIWLAEGLDAIEDGIQVRYGPFKLTELAPGQRILVDAIEVKLTRNANGSLSVLTPGSTQAVAMVQRHASIVRTRRFSFDMP
jgi:hypothetical protein